jgi:hypothetical protein
MLFGLKPGHMCEPVACLQGVYFLTGDTVNINIASLQANSLQSMMIPMLLADDVLVPAASSRAVRVVITTQVVKQRCKR